MYNHIISILILVIVSLYVNITYAHPWKVDNNWGHTCYTDCELYWLEQWEYHYHKQVSWQKQAIFSSNLSAFLKSELATSQTVNEIRNNEVSAGKIDKEKRLVLAKKIQSIMNTFSWFKKEIEYSGYYMSLGHLYADIQPKLSQDNYLKSVKGYYPACINISDNYSSALNKSRNCLFLMMANIGAWRMDRAVETKIVFLRYYQKALNQLGKTSDLSNLWRAFQIYDSWFTKEPQPESASLSTNATPSVTKTQQSSNKWTKSELQQKITETEELLIKSKETYNKWLAIIQTSKETITKLQWYNSQYESKISYTRSDYQYYIDKARKNQDIEKQQLNAFYAQNGIMTSNTAGYDAIDTKYNKVISDLEYEMNNNISVYQSYIGNNNTRIQELEAYISEKTKKSEEFLWLILSVEKNLEMYKSEIAKL